MLMESPKCYLIWDKLLKDDSTLQILIQIILIKLLQTTTDHMI